MKTSSLCCQCGASLNLHGANLGRHVRCSRCRAALVVTENGLAAREASDALATVAPGDTADKAAPQEDLSEGNGDPRYLVARARKGMDALMKSGMYRQLDCAQVVVREGHGWFERSGHILATLPTAFFDKGSWKLSGDEAKHSFTLEGNGLDGMTENVAHIVQGALELVAEQLTESPAKVVIQRIRDGRVVFLGSYGAGTVLRS